MHSREEILRDLRKKDVILVSTFQGRNIKSRVMHFFVDDEFLIYLASMKNDPKISQIVLNPSVSLLAHIDEHEVSDSKEIEINGKAFIVKDKEEKMKGLRLLSERSLVVKSLLEAGKEDLLECIEVIPESLKFRVFKEIVLGNPPTVIEFPKSQIISEWKILKNKLKIWFAEVRAPFLTATIVPIFLGTSIAFYQTARIDLLSFVLALIGGIFLHMGCNVVNDYYDHKSTNDDINREFVRPFSGGSRMIQLGLLAPFEVFLGGLLFFVIGSGIGIYLAFVKGWEILLLGLIGVISSFFYTAPPLYFASRGMGELLVGINFGTLMTLGAYFVQTGRFSVEAILASLPVALLIAGVLYINEFPDYNADKTVGKRTLVVRLGREKAVIPYIFIMLLGYLIITISSLAGKLPLSALISFATLPLGFKAVQYAVKYHSNPFKLVPANAMTIMSHLFTGFLMTAAFLLKNNIYASVLIFAIFLSLVIINIQKIERKAKGVEIVERSLRS
ncbi:MAG: 1,4-dihydroxy-2-naphthoate octaprenyltransferase [Candidatus Aminicenantia bacterium]